MLIKSGCSDVSLCDRFDHCCATRDSNEEPVPWTAFANKYGHGYPNGETTTFSLSGAKAKCLEIGTACQAVTCDGTDTSCTVRADANLADSATGETTYVLLHNDGPRAHRPESCKNHDFVECGRDSAAQAADDRPGFNFCERGGGIPGSRGVCHPAGTNPKAATSGTLAYPSNVVVSSLDYVDALDLDITAGTMSGSFVSQAGTAKVVEAASPAATRTLKKVYLAKIESQFLKVVTLQIAFSGSQVKISQTAASYKDGFSSRDISTVDVNAEMASGMTGQSLAGSSTATGYGAATVDWSFNGGVSWASGIIQEAARTSNRVCPPNNQGTLGCIARPGLWIENAVMSSTYSSGYYSKRCIDGVGGSRTRDIEAGDCCHTRDESDPWISVELGTRSSQTQRENAPVPHTHTLLGVGPLVRQTCRLHDAQASRLMPLSGPCQALCPLWARRVSTRGAAAARSAWVGLTHCT